MHTQVSQKFQIFNFFASLFIHKLFYCKENTPTSPTTLFNAENNDLALDFIYGRHPENNSFNEDDYNEALWATDDILRQRPPCTK